MQQCRYQVILWMGVECGRHGDGVQLTDGLVTRDPSLFQTLASAVTIPRKP